MAEKVSFGDILSNGFKQTFQRNGLILAGIQAALLLLSLLNQFVLPSMGAAGFNSFNALLYPILIYVIVWLGGIIVSSAAMNTFVEKRENISDGWKDSFFYNILSFIGFNLLVGIPILVVAASIGVLLSIVGLEIGGLTGFASALLIGAPLGIIFGLLLIYVFSGLAFVSWRIYVENEGPIEAIKKSWGLSSGYRWYIIGFYALLGVGSAVVVLLSFFVYPLTAGLAQILFISDFSEFYLTVVEKKNAKLAERDE